MEEPSPAFPQRMDTCSEAHLLLQDGASWVTTDSLNRSTDDCSLCVGLFLVLVISMWPDSLQYTHVYVI